MKIIKILLKSFFIQTLLHKNYMQKYGYSFLTNNKINTYINSNPYFCNLIYGLYKKHDKINNNEIRIIASLCAMMGDNLIWNFLKPVILLMSMFTLYYNNFYILFFLFIIYNFYTTFLRTYGYFYGLTKADKKNELFKEWYFKKIAVYLRYLKIFFLGIAFAFIILQLLEIWKNI